MSVQYRCYLLDKETGGVWGLIGESDYISFSQMTVSCNGKLVPYGEPQMIEKHRLGIDKFDTTNSEQEAIEHLRYHKAKRKAQEL